MYIKGGLGHCSGGWKFGGKVSDQGKTKPKEKEVRELVGDQSLRGNNQA